MSRPKTAVERVAAMKKRKELKGMKRLDTYVYAEDYEKFKHDIEDRNDLREKEKAKLQHEAL